MQFFPRRSTAVSEVMLFLVLTVPASAQPGNPDPLPSWNDGAAKRAIVEFVRTTTDKAGPKYVPPEQRIVTFDQDGTLWTEHPMYTQVVYCLERVPALVQQKPELKDKEPFKTVLSGNREAMAKLPMKDLEEILGATLTGMPVEEFQAEVKKWLATAKHPRWNRPYTDLTYQPMLEVLKYFRANGYKTYIVTGGGQDFVRVYAEQVYGIPPEQVVGTMGGTKYGYDKAGKPFLTKEPKLLLNDNDAGKPEGIHLMIGRRPYASFGNTAGDQQMLEYTTAGDGARLGMLVLHDDEKREYAYGPAQGLPDTKIGAFSDALMTEAKQRGWTVISMKTDWRRLFPFEPEVAPVPENWQQNPVTAIDILLEPDATMVPHAQAANERLLKEFPKGFALGKSHQPHISCLQRYVRTADLDKVYEAVSKVLATERPTTWKLKASKYYYLPGGNSLPGLGLAGIVIEPNDDLLRYQQKLIDAVTPFTVRTGTAAAFVTTKEDPEINQPTIDYVATFVPDASGRRFNPHVTIGIATEDFLKKMLAEKFEAFTFSPVGASVYHLGNFGTAREKLKSWELKP
jgi:phosphoglycolate phosphatase-like HAD superfamily hydrolase